MDKSENEKIQEIGDNFYQTCEANEQSGKTLWIGIERMMSDESDFWVNENQRKVSVGTLSLSEKIFLFSHLILHQLNYTTWFL